MSLASTIHSPQVARFNRPAAALDAFRDAPPVRRISLVPMPLAPRLLLVYSRPEGAFEAYDAVVNEVRDGYGAALGIDVASPETASSRLRTWTSAAAPTVLVVRAGEVLSIVVGQVSSRELRCLLDRALASS